jgi:hypothetical protein
MERTCDMLAETEYPITSEELIEQYGDRRVQLPVGSELLREILRPMDSETFEHPEDAEFAIRAALGENAIGRKGYSDRDPTPLGSPYGPRQLSF